MKGTETVKVTVTVTTASTDNSGNSGTDNTTVTQGDGYSSPSATLDFNGTGYCWYCEDGDAHQQIVTFDHVYNC